MNILKKIFNLISLLFILWIVISYLVVVATNLHRDVYASWNFFEILVKIHELIN